MSKTKIIAANQVKVHTTACLSIYIHIYALSLSLSLYLSLSDVTTRLGPRPLNIEVFRSRTDRHTHKHTRCDSSEHVTSPSHEPLPAQHTITTRRTSMLTAGFKPAIQTNKRPQTYALDRMAQGSACMYIYIYIYTHSHTYIHLSFESS